jgi:UDP-2,3-diacylglucosamine pyrophosphatase LpxH
MALITGRTKKIFISDIHMSDAWSMRPPHPYCWLQKNIPIFADFLDEQLLAKDVAEIVILGDLFDQWVIPVDRDPLLTIAEICKNPANKNIIENLKTIADSSQVKLTYVPGNHDMCADKADITSRKKFIENTFPGINFICDSDKPNGVYHSGKLAAEHGNMYCLFNAPDTWTTSNSFLPLGYYISRLIANKVAKEGLQEDYHDVFNRFVQEFQLKPDFIEDLFFAITDDAGLNKDDNINMNGFIPSAISIKEIGNLYQHLARNWDVNHKTIRLLSAIIGDIGDLLHAANKEYLSQCNTNIVIFGHTHQYALKKHRQWGTEEREEESLNPPSLAIYANCGAWVDTMAVCTYIETEEDPKKKIHYVRIKSFPDPEKVILEGFVNL